MARALVRYKPAVTKPQSLKNKTWKDRLKQPWSTTCDARAVVAIVLLLHCQSEKKVCVTIEDILDWIKVADLTNVSTMRRADIKEAFFDRPDARATVELLVKYLVGEGVLLPELSYHTSGDLYQLDPDEISTLDAAHAYLARGKARGVQLKVV